MCCSKHHLGGMDTTFVTSEWKSCYRELVYHGHMHAVASEWLFLGVRVGSSSYVLRRSQLFHLNLSDSPWVEERQRKTQGNPFIPAARLQ